LNRLLPDNIVTALGFGGDSASPEAMIAAIIVAVALCGNGMVNRMAAKTKGTA